MTTKPFIMFREAIKTAMEEQKVSQVQLAEELGVTRSSINNYLSGRRKLSVENIEKAFKYLNICITLSNK